MPDATRDFLVLGSECTRAVPLSLISFSLSFFSPRTRGIRWQGPSRDSKSGTSQFRNDSMFRSQRKEKYSGTCLMGIQHLGMRQTASPAGTMHVNDTVTVLASCADGQHLAQDPTCQYILDNYNHIKHKYRARGVAFRNREGTPGGEYGPQRATSPTHP